MDNLPKKKAGGVMFSTSVSINIDGIMKVQFKCLNTKVVYEVECVLENYIETIL